MENPAALRQTNDEQSDFLKIRFYLLHHFLLPIVDAETVDNKEEEFKAAIFRYAEYAVALKRLKIKAKIMPGLASILNLLYRHKPEGYFPKYLS